MTRRRTRPQYLSDAILTKAAEAGTQRLLERVGIMNAQFAESVTVASNLRRKALIWIKTKAINETPVTISQFASAMKLKRADAITLISKLMRFVGNSDDLKDSFFVFVEGYQIPDWMRPFLSKTDESALVLRARMRYTSLLDRMVHDEVLTETYGADFYDALLASYTKVEFDSLQAILRSGVDLLPVAPAPLELVLEAFKNPNWASVGYGSANRRISNTLPLETKVELSFGSVKMDVLQALPTDKPVLLEHRPHREEANHYTPDQVLQHYKTAQTLVNLMFEQQLYLVNTSTSFNVTTKRHRSSFLFVRKDNLGSTVRITLPWEFLLFRRVK